MSQFIYLSVLNLNRKVVCSRPAARSAGSTEPSFVLLTENIWAEQQPVWDPADVPAATSVRVRVCPQVSAILDLIGPSLLPPGRRVAAHLQEVHPLGGGGHFVLLCGHVLRVLLVRQAVVGEGEGQEVRGANHTLAEVWRRGRGRWRRQGELAGQRGVGGSDGLLCVEEPPETKRRSL